MKDIPLCFETNNSQNHKQTQLRVLHNNMVLPMRYMFRSEMSSSSFV
jgi:hypothetical protein